MGFSSSVAIRAFPSSLVLCVRSRFGLPFAFYDPTKEKKLEVWRMSTNSAPFGHRLSGRLSNLHSRFRSSSKLGSSSRRFGAENSGGFSRRGPSGQRWSFSHPYRMSNGRVPPSTSAASGVYSLPQAQSLSDMVGRFDRATLRRIRREYAESISLKGSHGQQGLIRLVLQSISGPAAPGAASPQVDRVVVCVRRPVVKGSTYLVFFEATRSLPDIHGMESLPWLGVGFVKEKVQLDTSQLQAQLQRLERPDALIGHGAEEAWKHFEGGANHLERYLPWPGADKKTLLHPAAGSRPSGEAAVRAKLASTDWSASKCHMSADEGREKSQGDLPEDEYSIESSSKPDGQRGLDVSEGLKGPGTTWMPIENYTGATDNALRHLGFATEIKSRARRPSVLTRTYKGRSRGDRGGPEDTEVRESDDDETERPPLCSLDLSVNLFLVGAGLSLVDSKPAEIFYASVELLQVFFKQTQEGEKVRLSVGWVQIDNHTPMAYYPTMLRPITDLRVNVNRLGLGSHPNSEEDANNGSNGVIGQHGEKGNDGDDTRVSRHDRLQNPGPATQRLREASQRRRAANASFLDKRESGDAGELSRDENLCEAVSMRRSRLALNARRRSLSGLPVPEAEQAKALHSETEGLKLLEEEDAVAQLILERRKTMDGRGLTVIPQCVLRLAPLSVNIDFQLAFALLMFVDDVLRTTDLDLLQQSVKDIRTSETDTDSSSWRAMLGEGPQRLCST